MLNFLDIFSLNMLLSFMLVKKVYFQIYGDSVKSNAAKKT